jgi:alpha-L-fucosidase
LAGGDIDLGRTMTVSIARLEEDIVHGQVVGAHTLLGSEDGDSWRVLVRGTTIGYARIVRFEPATVRRLRLVINDAVAPPVKITVRLYAG